MATPQEKWQEQLDKASAVLAAKQDCDIVLYNGPIRRPFDDQVIDQISSRRRRKNALLLLTTYGGDANAAYRIARALQRNYKRVTAFVLGYCSSAGTLVVIGAHELVFSRHSELGPLDVQMNNKEEVGERTSGVMPMDALMVLENRARFFFEDTFRHNRFEMGLPTQLAAELSAQMVGQLYGTIFAQIDPMRLGEFDRANRVALEYGQRLNRVSQNLRENALARLVAGTYPSHEFVIDAVEAEGELFKVVRPPTAEEAALAEAIDLAMRAPMSTTQARILVLNEEPEEESDEREQSDAGQRHEGAAGGDASSEQADGGARGGPPPPAS